MSLVQSMDWALRVRLNNEKYQDAKESSFFVKRATMDVEEKEETLIRNAYVYLT